MERKNAWLSYDAAQKEQLTALCERYKGFITRGKTERECVDQAVEMAEKAGFISLEKARKKNKKLKAGDKVYDTIMGKSMILFTIGTAPMAEGMNILGAHIDSPRLDLKQNPLYEDTDFVLLDTHYYGGIKKSSKKAEPQSIKFDENVDRLYDFSAEQADIKNSRLAGYCHLPSFAGDDPTFYALMLLEEYLSGSVSSPLYKKLITQNHLATAVSAGFDYQRRRQTGSRCE